MAAPDPAQTIITLLTDNWDSTNTGGLTPTFQRITDKKRQVFSNRAGPEHQIYVWRSTQSVEPAGGGPANKHETDKFNVDVRSFGKDDEQQHFNVVEEVKRVFQLKKVLPTSDYVVLEFDGQVLDLSDKTHNIWRHLIATQLIRYNVSR